MNDFSQDRYDTLTANLVDHSRKAAERLLANPTEATASDAAHAIHTLANMVEMQHAAMAKVMAKASPSSGKGGT